MKKTLIVVDMQNGFIKNEDTIIIAEKIATLISKDIFDCVITTRFLNSDNSIYERLFPWSELKEKEDQEIYPAIKENVDYVFDKYVYNCVSSSFLQKLCQVNSGAYPERVYLAGVDTDCCVLSIATSLFENNIRPIVLSQYCASNGGLDSHAAGLKCLERLIGSKQIFDSELIQKKDLLEI